MSEPRFLHKLFPTCLYVAEIENASQLNEAMLPHIYQIREDDLANAQDPELIRTFENEGWTTFFSRPGLGLVNEAWTTDLQNAILRNVEHFEKMLHLNVGNRKLRISTLFANIHEELYHRHDAHTHAGSVFSGTYYVKSYPGAGKFRLVNPARALQFHEHAFHEQTELNVDEVAVDCVAGRMVMFQSHVPHSVDRPTIRGDRVAIAFNVNYD